MDDPTDTILAIGIIAFITSLVVCTGCALCRPLITNQANIQYDEMV